MSDATATIDIPSADIVPPAADQPAHAAPKSVVAKPAQRRSLVETVADRYGLEPDMLLSILYKTVMPAGARPEHVAAFLMVADQYRLNPVLRQIYAFPTKDGGIQPIVGVDGWAHLINTQPELDGIQFEDQSDLDGNLIAIKCMIRRKDRTWPVEVIEYLRECRRGTDPWKQWPARMLRHKALIQAARYAFSFTGIMDPDEYDRSSLAVADRTRMIGAPSGQDAPEVIRSEIVVEAPAARVVEITPPPPPPVPARPRTFLDVGFGDDPVPLTSTNMPPVAAFRSQRVTPQHQPRGRR